jgi:EmrB/QacA subfamily drug resistance transporter
MDNPTITLGISPIEAASQPPSAWSKQLLPWLVAVAFFMESLDTTIVNTAVPVIAHDMNVAPLSLKSVLASYTLSLAIFIPISGWMADRFGTRRMFASAIGLFTLASVLCGISSNMYMLIACRVLQGCGGAMMIPVGRLTLARAFDKSEFIRVLSFVTIPGWMGPILGPVAGAFIISHLPWGFIFLVNLPIGIAGLVLVHLYLPDYREKTTKPIDITGFILFGSGIALLSYVLEIFGDINMNPSETMVLLAISLALIAGYGLHAARTAFPLLQLSLFRIPTFSVAVGGSFLIRLAVGGVPFLLPLLYQVALGFTPIKSGLLILPQAIAGIIAKLIMPHILHRIGYRSMLTTNTVILGSLLMLFATVGPGTPVWLIVLQASCYGACTSLQYTSMNTMVYEDIDENQKSSAGSLASMAQELSISFGVAAAGFTTAFFMLDRFRPNPGDMMIAPCQRAFLILGAFTILSTFIFRRLKSENGGVRHPKGLSLTDGAPA